MVQFNMSGDSPGCMDMSMMSGMSMDGMKVSEMEASNNDTMTAASTKEDQLVIIKSLLQNATKLLYNISKEN